jgi:hypothetical protein
MHDTPPPTKFGDGSFIAELEKDADSQNSAGRWHHRFVPKGNPPFLVEIRVLRGNGEEIYFDEFAGDSVIKIELENDHPAGNAGNLIITGGPAYFQIDSDSKLGGPQVGAKGRRRYEHPGHGHSFHISRIVIEKPAGTVKLDEVKPDHEEEYVVMIWHDAYHPTEPARII